METRRLILLMIFTLSLIMLWDNYQASQGHPTLFGMPTGAASDSKQANAKPAVTVQAANDLPQAAAPVGGVGDTPSAEPVKVAAAETLTVRTDVLELQFSTQGGQLISSKLLQHPKAGDPTLPVQLFEQSDKRTYVAQAGLVGVAGAPNHRTLFEVVQKPGEPTAEKPTQQLKLRAVSGNLETLYVYTFTKGSYQIGFEMDVKNLGEQAVTPSAYVQITRDGNPLSTDSKFYSTFTGPAVYSPEGKYQKVKFESINKNAAEYTKNTDAGWVAMVQHYFVSAIVAQAGPRENFVRKVEDNLYSFGVVSPLGAVAPGQTAKYTSVVYTGPQDQRVLEKVAPGLELVVDYGWLTVIAQPIYWLLEKIHSVVGNWGWAIVLLTLLIKLAFFPLSAASYRSMAKMRKIGPRMQALKEQYGDDKMGFQRAMMDMYKREKINPLGGCMPIVVQIPVFISLYWVLLASVEMRNAPWYWVADLASPDDLITRFLPIALGFKLGILPIVMAITMFIQTKLNPTPPDPVQAKVMMVMPLVFSVMFVFFPAGLVLYWVVNNILSITQQWVITRKIESGAEQ
ncbi:membrane protein insertase YidC [Limnobacter humi]|uniref:Membrane protein insertase YidC n=1 Tax=Limnobacter humi TaxID=1778671 RepID=A0ABT1WDN4_9BURK|nr:membrane protein insertase YidC [Limnobacter humi]MCQ8895635.1 membrane protein insertase YidC [Limnobacter humi]